MYTSGTTGVPKGVVYTHEAVLAAFAALDAALPPADDVHAIAYIPFAHAGQRAMGHYRSMISAATTTFCADPATLPAVIRDARPSYLFGPPAVWQGVAATAAAGIDADTRAALGRSLEGVRTARRGESAAPLAPGDRARLAGLRARAGLDRLAQPFVSAAPPAAPVARGAARARAARAGDLRPQRAAAGHHDGRRPARHRQRRAPAPRRAGAARRRRRGARPPPRGELGLPRPPRADRRAVRRRGVGAHGRSRGASTNAGGWPCEVAATSGSSARSATTSTPSASRPRSRPRHR